MVNSKVITLDGLKIKLFFTLFIITLLTLFSSTSHAKDKPYPGKLIDIGTHRLYINCKGEGSPTVIIDSGIGGFSLEWTRIQDEISSSVRVCSYDRAGYGWSDPGPRPRTTAQISFELKRLLTAARIPGPYILIGHSFGGYNIRYFASQYPELVAGMVFVDSSHPEQFNTEEFKRIHTVNNDLNSQKYKNSFKVRLVRPVIANNYPEENKHMAYILMSTMKAQLTLMDELDNMELSAKQVSLNEHPPYNFPVVIITRGKRVWPENKSGDRKEKQWTLLQNDLENISYQSYHYLARQSGHIVHLDEPELVSENILFEINRAKAYMHEKELIEKFDIRLAHFGIVPTIHDFDVNYSYRDALDSNLFIQDNPIHQVLYNPNSQNLENQVLFTLR